MTSSTTSLDALPRSTSRRLPKQSASSTVELFLLQKISWRLKTRSWRPSPGRACGSAVRGFGRGLGKSDQISSCASGITWQISPPSDSPYNRAPLRFGQDDEGIR